jgi:hypothetical protein
MRAGCIAHDMIVFRPLQTRLGGTSTERLKTGPKSFQQLATSSARRVPPPLRFGAALVYVSVTLRKSGRDVGLAKSGFRPTESWAHSPFRRRISFPAFPAITAFAAFYRLTARSAAIV